MAGDWRSLPLTDLYEISSGLSKPRSDFGAGDGFLTFKDVLDNFFVPRFLSGLVKSTTVEQEKCSVKRGDVFLTRTSETQPDLGMSCVALRDYPRATFNGFTKRLRPKSAEEVVPEYAAYYFRGPKFRQGVTAMSSLSTRASLNNEMLSRLTIDLPPVGEQTAIGLILKSLDDKIELNRRMSETLEAMARALFKSWFVDFDPVRAKAERRDPGLPKHLADLFPARLVDSELGEIPEGWEVTSLGSVAALNPEVWSKTSRPARINYVDLSNTKWGRIEAITAFDAASAPSRAQRVLRRGDTIVGTVRPGNGSFAFIGQSDLTGSTGFAQLRPRRVSFAELVYLCATHPENIEFLSHIADGGAYPAVRPEVVESTAVVLAPDPVMNEFSARAGRWLTRIADLHAEAGTLAALRDTLLPKLISGELRITDPERFLKEVVP